MTGFLICCTKEALIKSLRALIRAFLQFFLRGKGFLSMVSMGIRIAPPPNPIPWTYLEAS